MKLSVLLLASAPVLLSACANTLNQITSDRYAQECAVEEQRGRLSEAEEACYRAVKNVDWGNLGPELKSQRLYNLARVKRQVGKFAEAENSLKESIAIEESVSGKDSLNVARRLVELAVNCAAQNKWKEGAEYLAGVIPLAQGFNGQERSFAKISFLEYGKKLRALGHIDNASRFEKAADAL